MNTGNDSNVPSNVTNDMKRTRSVNFNNLICQVYKRKKAYSMPINFCLLNTRSINGKELFISDYVSEIDIDILAMTEAWLREQDSEFSIGEICPTGYHLYYVTRKTLEVEELVYYGRNILKSKSILKEDSLPLNTLMLPWIAIIPTLDW